MDLLETIKNLKGQLTMKITVTHAAELDVDLNISRARGGTSKLMPLELGA
jgi:hypothetical protein